MEQPPPNHAAAAGRVGSRWRGWPGWLLAAGALLVLVVLLVALRASSSETLELVGVVERKNIDLLAPVPEEIVERPVAIGQAVARGQVVVRLNTEVAELELKAAEASRSAAEAGLAAAQQDFARVTGLARARIATGQNLDLARRLRDEAEAALAERSARVAQARKRLKDLTVVSTVDGVVDQLPYEVGERVPAGSVLAVVLARDKPWIRVWLPARVVARLRAGAAARVAVEGLDGTFQGRLEDIGRAPEFTPHFALTERERGHLVYESRVVVLGAPADLRPGVPATVTLQLSQPPPPAGGSR
ncbi:MAG TPA: efflux RND transporter periplasmic adaptor subunit [Thermoanaerobaculia bacterium]|nr:efflux RND transporter periplasmic adaptor subunit [Thermoanaerobaculia bacterium]